MNDEAKITAIQTLLKTKYPTLDLGKSGKKGDGVDGVLGPNTLTALSTAMKSKTAPVVKEPVVEPVKTDVKPGTTVVEPVVKEPVVEPVVKEPVVQAAPLSNRDQRRERQDLRRSNRRDMQNLRAGQQGQQQ